MAPFVVVVAEEFDADLYFRLAYLVEGNPWLILGDFNCHGID